MESKQVHLTHPKYRRDIDGLRAVAILSVLGYHAFPENLTGGFVGVDIFFVISGYLISTIILENLEKESFNFGEFYARRVKRIFPALFLLLVACFVFGWFGLLADEYKQLGVHIAAGASFLSNFALLRETGYFDSSAENKPLLHLWSLGIEEQFYIVWPFLLWLVRKNRTAIVSLIAIIALASFSLNIIVIQRDITMAFYSPLTRFWELLCGAMLAELTRSSARTKTMRSSGTIAHSLSVAGALSIILAFLLINPTTHFPGAWALLPVVGAVFIILAGPQAVLNRFFLSNQVLVGIGLISFPLYLWHWPLLAFTKLAYGGNIPVEIRWFLLCVSTLLAWGTYKFVETPIRFGRVRGISAWAFVVPMVAIGVVGIWSSKSEVLSAGASAAYARSREVGWQLDVGSKKQRTWCHDKFPERTHLGASERDDNFCFLQKNATPDVLMVGDSGNLSLFPGLTRSDDYNLLMLSASSAAPFYDTRTTESADKIRFYDYRLTNQALDYAISAKNIKVVVMTFLNGPSLTFDNNPFKIVDVSNTENHSEEDIFSEKMRFTLEKLRVAGKQVIYVLPNAGLNFDPRDCLADFRPIRFGADKGRQCAIKKSLYYETYGGDRYRTWVYNVLRDYPNVQIFDMAKPFCDSENCWAEKNGNILYRDNIHLSVEGSTIVAPGLSELIRNDLAAAKIKSSV